MAEIVRLDRPHHRYSDLELHFRIAQAVDAGDPGAWLAAMRRLAVREGWSYGQGGPASVRVPRAFYDLLSEHGSATLTSFADELYFRGVPIVPVED